LKPVITFSFHLHINLLSGLCPSNCICNSNLFHVCNMCWPSHTSQFDCHANIWQEYNL
jgi:hypothetical protein